MLIENDQLKGILCSFTLLKIAYCQNVSILSSGCQGDEKIQQKRYRF